MEAETFKIAIVYNSDDGSISFIINETNQGIAFQDDSLKDMILYPAVSLREGSKATLINHISEFYQMSL